MNRDKHEIYKDILKLCQHETCRAKIMQTCNLSFTQASFILPFLLERGFLKENWVKALDRNGSPRSLNLYQRTDMGTVLLLALENAEFILNTEFNKKCLKVLP